MTINFKFAALFAASVFVLSFYGCEKEQVTPPAETASRNFCGGDNTFPVGLTFQTVPATVEIWNDTPASGWLMYVSRDSINVAEEGGLFYFWLKDNGPWNPEIKIAFDGNYASGCYTTEDHRGTCGAYFGATPATAENIFLEQENSFGCGKNRVVISPQ